MTSSLRIAHVTTTDVTHRFLLLEQLRLLRSAGMDVTAISAPGPWVDELLIEGIGFIPWPHATRAWDPVADSIAFLELASIFRRERFDLVHTHNPKPGVLGRIAARLTGVPCVLNTVHGLYATREDPIRRRVPVVALETLAALFSDLELYQSEEDLAWSRRFLGVRDKAVHLGNGCDLGRFDPAVITPKSREKVRHELGFTDADLVVGTIARLVREKGLLELFTAAPLVVDRVPNARFVVVGERDPTKPDSLTRAELREAATNVTLTGWRTDIPELLSAMDVFVLPSWREGMPRAAIEAAGMALPLVLTDIRGCREVVRHGVEGYLVPVRDPASLASAITTLLCDDVARARMGRAARARALASFDGRVIAARVLMHTNTILAKKHPRVRDFSDGPVEVRRATVRDVAALARLHRSAMPDAFLSALGDGFLRQLYRSMIRDPGGVALVAVQRGRVVGFTAGVRSVRRFLRRFALRRGVPALLLAAPRLLRGSVLRRVIETASYPGSTDPSIPTTDAELLGLAVDSDTQGKGVGARLVKSAMQQFAASGAETMKLFVAADNRQANGFYERMGFRRHGTIEVHAGAPSYVWVVQCRS